MTQELPEIVLEDNGAKGRYFLRAADGAQAEIIFTKVGEHEITLDHTEVPEAFRGQGVGVKLVARAVADARAAGRKIVPLCPFAAAQFSRHPEWADVLKQ